MPQQRSRANVTGTRARAAFISVELKQVRLSLDGRTVLHGIDWSIRPAQRWMLVGRNGAGKTLLLKLLAGDLWPQPPHGRRRYVYRGESFDDPYGIKQQIAYVGAERQDRYEHYDWNHRVEDIIGTGLYHTEIALDPLTARDRERIGRLLQRLHLQALRRRRFLSLSYGERRLVLLARALASAPKLLLLDELFNGLDGDNRARALHCLAVLSRSALPWVLASHRPEDTPDFATHLCEIEAGRIKAQGVLPVRPERRRALSRQVPARVVPRPSVEERPSQRAKHEPAALLIAVRKATVWRDGIAALQGLSLEVRAAQCWVVHGANGSGKSSFMQLLYGDLGVASGGSIERAGIKSGVPIARFKRRVGLVAPELQAIHPRYLRVDEVVASGVDASIGCNGERAAPTREVQRSLRRVGAAALERRALRTLSYGQMRRVLFARALVHEPDILLLDEPYAGLDAPIRARLRALVERALEAGVTIVIATHDRAEWPHGVTHELELVRGKMVYGGPLRAPAERSPEHRRGPARRGRGRWHGRT